MGSKRDYFIAEAVSEDAGDQGELPPNVELKGANGVNKLSYFVTNDGIVTYFLNFLGLNLYILVMLGEWLELPIVTPEQLIQTRKVKYFFTGDLEQKVITNPHFVGLEKYLVSFTK